MTDREQKWEERAKWAEDMGVPNLAAALRNKSLQDTCKDIDEYSGWIRCATDIPAVGERVLVTDGEHVWVAQMAEHEEGAREWDITQNEGYIWIRTDTIIAWMYMPSVPSELKESI